MKPLLITLATLIVVPIFAQQQTALTARQYFTELRDAKAFDRYSDKYVCFPDTDKPNFWVVIASEDVVNEMTLSDDKEGLKQVAKAGVGLFVRTYYKGVENGDTDFYKKVEGEYRLDLDAPIHHGRMVFIINWKTGRYRLKVYALDVNKDLPAIEGSGKCELIHPNDTPSVAGEK
jgi:hypothetical protein